MAIATSMMHYMFENGSYDIGVLLTGDLDFFPVIQRLQSYGKKILLVTIDKIGNIQPTNTILIDRYDFIYWHRVVIRHYSNPPLYLFAAGTDITQDLLDAFLVNDAHTLAGNAQTDEAFLGFNPETVLVQIGQKPATGAVLCV